ERLLTEEGGLTLPGEIAVHSRGECLWFAPLSRPSEPFCQPIAPPEETVLGGMTYLFRLLSREEFEKEQKVHKKLFKNALSYDMIEGNVTARSRMPGDAYRPVGRGGTKTLKKL